jgi:hypothetical protein
MAMVATSMERMARSTAPLLGRSALLERVRARSSALAALGCPGMLGTEGPACDGVPRRGVQADMARWFMDDRVVLGIRGGSVVL